MADIVCRSKGAALSALDIIAENTPMGTQRDTLLAVRRWVNQNSEGAEIPEAAMERLRRIFKGSEEEKKGRAWIERETGDPGHTPGRATTSTDEGNCHMLHETIHEPEDGAELKCFWDAGTKAWQPVHCWA